MNCPTPSQFATDSSELRPNPVIDVTTLSFQQAAEYRRELLDLARAEVDR